MERKYAVIADIHANLEALNAVLDHARSQSVTDFICAGDIVGYNASPAECLRLIRQLSCPVVCGNHDYYCSHDEVSLDDFQPAAAIVIDWTRRQLSLDDKAWLKQLPLSKVFTGITLVHATLDMPERWGYVFDAYMADAHFNYQNTPVCFHGHTHVPVIFEKKREVLRIPPGDLELALGTKYFINAGSVGQPRDGDPRASYLTYEPKTRTIRHHRVDYDIETAMEKIQSAGLPDRLALRLGVGQ